MNEDLYNKIAKLTLDINKNVKFINSGGCGRFALYLIEELEKLNIPCTAILFDENVSSKLFFVNFNAFIRNYEDLAFCHVMVKVDDYYIDGEVILNKVPERWRKYKQTKCTKKQLIKIVKKGNWNNEYNTEQNSLVQKLIQNNLLSA